MSYVYTGTDTNATSVTLPSDGDDKDAASVDVPFETIWDRLNHLNAPEQNSGDDYLYAARDETRVQRITPYYDAATWTPVPGAPFLEASVATATFLVQPLELPHGSTLTQLTVNIDPADGHVGVPGSPPAIQIYEVDDIGGMNAIAGGGAVDPSASAGAYDIPHPIQVTPNYVVNTALYQYVVVLSSEDGANAMTGMKYLNCNTTSTVGRVDAGAS